MFLSHLCSLLGVLASLVLLSSCSFLSPTLRRQMTYPLDTLRLRLAVDPASRSIRGAARALMREGSHGAFFRGLGASMIGAPCTSPIIKATRWQQAACRLLALHQWLACIRR